MRILYAQMPQLAILIECRSNSILLRISANALFPLNVPRAPLTVAWAQMQVSATQDEVSRREIAIFREIAGPLKGYRQAWYLVGALRELSLLAGPAKRALSTPRSSLASVIR
jgi:hypothetical protein